MIVSGSVHLRTFLSHARCQIDLTADDRVNPLRLCLLIESDRTIHDTVIGDGNRIHPKFLCASDQLLDTARAVQQTVFRMHMQMSKGHSVPPFLSVPLPGYEEGDVLQNFSQISRYADSNSFIYPCVSINGERFIFARSPIWYASSSFGDSASCTARRT